MNNSLNHSPKFAFTYVLGILPFAVIGIFYYLSVKYSIDIPWFDDVENIPYFLVNYLEAPTLIEKWQAIIRPNNEHRVLAARMIVLAQYGITGGLNFRYLAFFGNLSVLVLFGIIGYSYLRQGGKWFLLVPVAFFIFNFQSYAGTFMTIMAMQYQMVILLSVVSFYFLAKKSRSFFFVAILFAYLDTFSMGNGMMVWPSGLVLLLFQLRWRDALIWFVAAAAAIFLYFHGYDFVQGNDRAFTYILQYPVRTFIAFFTMLGGDFDVFANMEFTKRMVIPTLAGLVLVIVLVVWLLGLLSSSELYGRWVPANVSNRIGGVANVQDENNRWNAFWLGTLVYVLISMALVVVFRTRFDPHIILWSTYKMYPAVLTSVAYIIVIQSFRNKNQIIIYSFFLIISGIVWASTLVNYIPIVEQTSKERTAFGFNQRRNGVGLGATKNSAFEKMLATTLEKVEKRGIYALPKPLIHPDEEKITLKNSQAQTTSSVLIRSLTPDILDISLTDQVAVKAQRYIVMESEKNLYLFAISPKTLHAICPVGTIWAGMYNVGIWVVNEEKTKIFSTTEKVNIQ